MQSNLLTAGQFAKLARTTKRTVLWYDKQSLLKPTSEGDNGYRYYEPRQIIDFQVILLLRKMGFSIHEVKSYIKQDDSLEQLFRLKETAVKKEISDLKRSLTRITTYYHNLSESSTLVRPEAVDVSPLSIYYIEKEGPYSKIKDYCLELKNYISHIPRTTVYLTIFFGGYEPNKARMKIAVIARDNMVLKKRAAGIVRRGMLPAFQALKHTHHGSGALVSLLWQEMEKYASLNGYAQNTSLPFVDLEMYKKTSLNGENDEEGMVFELYLPIKIPNSTRAN